MVGIGNNSNAQIKSFVERIERLSVQKMEIAEDIKDVFSTSIYADVLSSAWRGRMDAAWDAIAKRHHRLPWVHMLRGMACCGERWPFASVDSTDVARNHNRPQNTPRKLSERWDALQCPASWKVSAKQLELV